MQTNNPILNNLFNGLSSIYRTDDGMVSSNLFTILNAEAEVFSDIQRKINQVKADTYISTASPDALEANFGILVGFPKPPRLNTLTNGNEIYRAMLKSMFHVFQSGATVSSMDQALSTAISFLTVDPNTSQSERVINYTHLYTVDSGTKLTWIPVQASGGNIIGPARNGNAASGDIAFFPADLIVTDFNPTTNVISFTGNANTGINYSIIYNRDNRPFNGNNWINLSNVNELNVSPFDLKSTPVLTFDNPEFSYWWNNFNANGLGVVIDAFSISGNDSSLIWRLPEKTVTFVSPYSEQVVTRTIEFYNESGTAYDINVVDDINRDVTFYDTPLNYYTDVSSDFNRYYIRYSANSNGPAPALSKFNGSLPLFLKHYRSIDFASSNFGQLDFFEKNNNFTVNNLFGTGTTNIWLNVPNVNGNYTLSDDFLFQRQYSLHERILFSENFEGGQLNTIDSTNWSGTRLSEVVGVPSFQKEDCLLLMGLVSGDQILTSPKLNSQVLSQANHVEIDFFDSLNSGTQTLIDITRTGTLSENYNRLRFGIDDDITGFEYSAFDPLAISKRFGFVETFFENTTSTNRAVSISGSISNSYLFVTGTNPNILSDMAMQPTGTFTVNIRPNADNNLISNSDQLYVQYNDNGISSNIISFTISNYKLVGTGSISGLPCYGTETISLVGSPSGSTWSILGTSIVGFNSGTEAIATNNFGSLTTIPYSTGTNLLQILKGSGISINGISYTGSWADPGMFWDTLGYGRGSSGFVAGDVNSIAITTNPNSNFDFYHYKFGNASTEKQFQNNLNSFSGTTSSSVPYFYQIFTNPYSINAPKNYISSMPRTYGWHTLKVDFSTEYTGTNIHLGDVKIFNASIAFSGNIIPISGIQMITNTKYPLQEYSYFDNINISYYNASQVLPEYGLSINMQKDWEGSSLSESTIVDNKFFDLEPMPNFQFNVVIKGLDPEFIFIINKIIDKLKPAHTIATSIFEQDQILDTTQLVPLVSNTLTDWESGNIQNNIIIKATGQGIVIDGDLPGFISISGN